MQNFLKQLYWIFVIATLIALGISIFSINSLPLLITQGVLLFAIFIYLIASKAIPENKASPDMEERYRLETVVESLRDGIIMYDKDFTILVFNKTAENILGVSAKEVLGISFTKKLRSGVTEKFQPLLTLLFPALAPSIIRRSELGAYPQIVDISLITPPLELRVFTDRILNRENEVVGFIKIVHDRTREILLLREKSQFIAVASHQLRTPLTALKWTLENLEKEPLSEDQQEMVAHATGSVNRMMKVANDLLDVARIEEGRFGYQFQTVDILPFLEDALVQAQEIAKQYGVKLYFEKPDTPTVEVTADLQKLGMVIGNLLDNAIKYNIKNGQITLRVKRLPNESFIQIDIEDTGIGIPPDSVSRIFTKFFRAENAGKISVEGTGLGLFIAQNIIRQHGGKMWVKSQLNRGSTFSFTLPTNPALLPPKEVIFEE